MIPSRTLYCGETATEAVYWSYEYININKFIKIFTASDRLYAQDQKLETDYNTNIFFFLSMTFSIHNYCHILKL